MSDDAHERKGSLGPGKDAASKGGVARAAALTAEERREIAKAAARARWDKEAEERHPDILKATHSGELELGETTIDCAVLEDGTRVLSQRGIGRALGRGRGGQDWRTRDEDGGGNLPYYMVASNLKPFISSELLAVVERPIRYRPLHGGVLAHGLEASALPQVCDVWLRARDAEALKAQQLHIAAKADMLMRALAHVGIIALVDEVTGYQEQRDRDELNRILSAYISEELLPWTKRFPDAFYRELFRLHGWEYRPLSVKRPRLIGRLTGELVYDQLPDGVVEQLRKKNPVVKEGRRRYKLHQFLTEEIGNRHLEKHLAAVITLMRISPNWKSFKKVFDKAFPRGGGQLEIDLGQDDPMENDQGGYQ